MCVYIWKAIAFFFSWTFAWCIPNFFRTLIKMGTMLWLTHSHTYANAADSFHPNERWRVKVSFFVWIWRLGGDFLNGVLMGQPDISACGVAFGDAHHRCPALFSLSRVESVCAVGVRIDKITGCSQKASCRRHHRLASTHRV